MNAKVNPNGNKVSDCKFEYGTSEAYGSTAPCTPEAGEGTTPVAVSAALTSLIANTTYHFRISATNGNGTGKGADATFKTLPNAPTVKSEPASAATQTGATLNATVNPNGGEVTKCEFEYGTTTSYGSSAPCTPAPGSGTSNVAVSAAVSSLSANTTYHFRVSATNASGTSKGADETFKTEPPPPTVETKPAGSVTQTTATVKATVNPNGSKVTDCKFEYGTSASYGSTAACTQTVGEGVVAVAVSAAVSSLSANTTYHFRVSATNASGTSKGADETFKTEPPPPTVETKPAASITQTMATLKAIVNPNGSEVTTCEFEYGTSTAYGSKATCTPAPGSGTSNVAVSAAISGLTANTTYHFRISATNAGGTSPGADQTLKTLPNAPTVKTEPAGAATMSATLNGLVNPNGGEVTECNFEYGTTTSYGKSAPCTPAPGSGTTNVAVSAAIGSLAENKTYHVRIVATNEGGESKGSDLIFKTTSTPITLKTEPASSATQTTAVLHGLVNPNGVQVTECRFEYGIVIPSGKTAACTPAPGSGSSSVPVSAALTGLVANTTYHFRIIASNEGGPSEGLEEAFKTLPNPPTVVTEGASAVTQVGASLNGTLNANGGPVNACSFEYGPTAQYGSIVPCPALPPSGEVRLTVTIAGLAPGTTYHYRIVAANQGGASVGADQTFTTAAAPKAPSSGSSPPGTTHVTTIVVVPDSTFKVMGATLNLRSYWITFTESVHDPGTFTWVLTFKNGPFGAFAARHKACRAGRRRLKGRCRPSRVLFAKGSQYVPAPGNATFTVVPTSAGVSALKNAFKRKASLPVRAVVIYQSAHGGPSVTHIQKLVVKLRK